MHGNTKSLLDSEGSIASGVYLPELNDPDHSMAHTSTLWELTSLSVSVDIFVSSCWSIILFYVIYYSNFIYLHLYSHITILGLEKLPKEFVPLRKLSHYQLKY